MDKDRSTNAVKSAFDSDEAIAAKGVQRLETGIPGLDELLGGGIAKGRTMLVSGSSGTGKTVLLNEFLYRGVRKFGQGGIFITFEERPGDIVRNVAGFGWDYDALIASEKLAIVDCSQSNIATARSGEFDWEVLFKRVEHMVKKTGAKRAAIDSISTAFGRLSGTAGNYKVRELLFTLMDRLKAMGVTTMISAEKLEAKDATSRHGFEEFVSDGALNLAFHHGQTQVVRTVCVVKMRGLYFRSGIVEYTIDGQGIMIYPKIPIDRSFARTDFDIREKTGVEGLDRAMNGGIPQGHMMLIAGNTGAGKTMLGLQFLLQGIKEGNNGVFIALEEPVEQVRKTAQAHGWGIEAAEKQGLLRFVRCELLDISADRLLYHILKAVRETGAKRVVIDSVSSLESATMNRDKVREFLIQISTYFKTRGTTCYMNYLSAKTFGASKGQLLGNLTTNEMRLSSIVDGIILLRYVERNQQIMRLMNIFKLRGSDHERAIFRYDIATGGIQFGSRYGKYQG